MRMTQFRQVTILRELCQRVAWNHIADACYALTSGIYVMTAANAAIEAVGGGKDPGIPHWRTLKIGVFLNEKYREG